MEPESDSTFSCTVDQLGNDVRIAVTGEIDMLTALQLVRAFTRSGLVFDGIVFDLRGVTFFGSQGIAALLMARELCGERDAVMSVKPSRVVARVVALVRLTEALGVESQVGKSSSA
ncbi:MAG TPA: STAS domain-containing protein [Pseudonocardiaceae bacterium]|nr:STAS domain-containing protein [Pseudonocardiaceae bacterium]